MQNASVILKLVKRFRLFQILTGVLVASFLAACGTAPPYSKGDGPTRQLGDGMVRYGSIAAAGAGGFFLGEQLLGGIEGGIVGAAVGAASAYALTRFYDNKRLDAYKVGFKDGENSARGELVNEIWRREAVYGIPPPYSEYAMGTPRIRNVYVPTRTINGVTYPGDYQQVPVYK